MKNALHLMMIGAWMAALMTPAAALPPPDEPPVDPGEEDPPPPPPPPPAPTNFSRVAQKVGSIGNSTLGASYQAAIQVTADGARQNFMARGYAHAGVTLLGSTKNLGIINGMVDGGARLGTEASMFLLGQQVFSYKDSFTASFDKTFTAIDWRTNMWSYQNSWTFLGTGVSIRLAVDGGTTLSGTASAGSLRASGTLTPRIWVDAGGTLSLHLLWITAGSLTGTVHLVEATGSGTASIDASNLPFGGPIHWSVSGWARFCAIGGTISGCALGKCGTLVTIAPICPGWLDLSGQASGTL